MAPTIPRSFLTGGAALGVRLKRIETVTETVLASSNAPDWRLSLRWKSRSGSGISIDRSNVSQPKQNPYSHSGKLQPRYDEEATLRLGFVARFSACREVVGRWAHRNQVSGLKTKATLQWALDWIQQRCSSRKQTVNRIPRYVLGLRMNQQTQAGVERDRSIRILGRSWFPIHGPWVSDVQLQTGVRTRNGRSGWTALLAYSLRRDIGSSKAAGSASNLGVSYATSVLIRRHAGERTTLYASYPSVRGAFPALSGSSNLASLGQYIRMETKSGTSVEVFARTDWKSSTTGPHLGAMVTLQIRIPLG